MNATGPEQASDEQARIDPRGPRFTAWITSALLGVGLFLALLDGQGAASGLGERASQPGFVLLAGAGLLFVWGFTAPSTAPWGLLFRQVVRPRLSPPRDVEDPRPPRFAQLIGFTVVTIGLALHLLGVPWALVVASAAALGAAFLNAAFGFCLGCQIYLGLARAGLIRPRGGLA
ncbi:DUF4395 domain-containing protein [Nesterenkonia muleiensis]|uniref:DUF4395 domain-containing protein n=1 Tax=Nesterenkonia muleiensis TaxID=2282648 RepID=UPI000E735217|nr:DUF4395 domain-containing protein [Nesterenkonia muleiensis]